MILHRLDAHRQYVLARLAHEAVQDAHLHHQYDQNEALLRFPAAIIIDMDGTLVLHRHPSLLEMLEKLQTAGRLISGCWPEWAARGRNAGMPGQRLYGHRLLHRLRRGDVGRIVSPADGVEAFLALVRASGVPIGLVSNGLGHGYGRDILSAYDLDQFFDAVVFREDVERPKPAAEALLKIASLIKVPGNRDATVWYIGDQAKDMAAARAAAATGQFAWQAILFSKRQTPPFAAALNADHSFSDWHALMALFSKLAECKALRPVGRQILDDRT